MGKDAGHRGRPRKLAPKRVILRLTPEEWEALCEVAEREDRSASKQALRFVRGSLRAVIERRASLAACRALSEEREAASCDQ